jgi:hypothetical protein
MHREFCESLHVFSYDRGVREMRPIPNLGGYVAMNGLASPQRSRSRPDVIAITSSSDVNDKGNRRAKVMPG